MIPKKISYNDKNQGDLFRVMLRDVVDPKHPMVILANSINWEAIETKITPSFTPILYFKIFNQPSLNGFERGVYLIPLS